MEGFGERPSSASFSCGSFLKDVVLWGILLLLLLFIFVFVFNHGGNIIKDLLEES